MPHLSIPTRSGLALVAVGDPTRDRTVYATIVLLVALGVAMIMLALWLGRSTRPDPEVLAPLEQMGERRWRRADPVWQRRRLDEVRPTGADPLEPTSAPPATDAEFERGPQPIGFDDLVASSPATVAVASTLPAPPAEALPVDGPTDVGGNDVVGYDVAGTAQPLGATASAPADDIDDEEPDAVTADVDAADAGDDADGEDITGEQDADDFFDIEPDDIEPDDIEPVDIEPVVMTDVDENDEPG